MILIRIWCLKRPFLMSPEWHRMYMAGVPKKERYFGVCPEILPKKISFGVAGRAKRSAGIRLSFKTNSRRIGLCVKLESYIRFSIQTHLSSRDFEQMSSISLLRLQRKLILSFRYCLQDFMASDEAKFADSDESVRFFCELDFSMTKYLF